MEIQAALAEILEKFGQTDYKNRKIASIPLHRINEYDLSGEVIEALLNLPYAADDTGIIN